MRLDIVGCARCRGDGHDGLDFKPLTFPVEYEGQDPLTHWATCPTTGEPILLAIVHVVAIVHVERDAD